MSDKAKGKPRKTVINYEKFQDYNGEFIKATFEQKKKDIDLNNLEETKEL